METRLAWIPLGAGGHVVKHTGGWYERLVARRERRPACDLYHAALEVELPAGRYAVEMGPAWGPGSGGSGVLLTGPVGLRPLGRSRWFRYEVRCTHEGEIPDIGYAVGGPRVVPGRPGAGERLVALVARSPALTWGRDEVGAGEMWNSNSLVAWLLVSSGHDATGLAPPAGGRAPGWHAGLLVAARYKGESSMKRTLTGTVAAGLAALALALPVSAEGAEKPSGHGPSDITRDRTPHAAQQQSDPILCPVDEFDVPEYSTGVVTEWLSYGESLTVSPRSNQIWAGVWFTGWNGPEGWAGTSAPWYYPAPGAREYSLIARLGNGPYQYVGSSPRTFTNTKWGYLQRVRLRVNDNNPGNGDGAFRVLVSGRVLHGRQVKQVFSRGPREAGRRRRRARPAGRTRRRGTPHGHPESR